MDNLGAKIKTLREERGIEARDLAARIDVSPAYMSMIENNKRIPSDDKLELIANILGIPLPELQNERAINERYENFRVRPDVRRNSRSDIIINTPDYDVYLDVKMRIRNRDIPASVHSNAINVALLQLINDNKEQFYGYIQEEIEKQIDFLRYQHHIYSELRKEHDDDK
jgi:transcriptional regulator with XRE-family HTH domain